MLIKKGVVLYNWVFILSLILLAGSPLTITAQNTHFQIWPEANVWYKITPTFRISSTGLFTRYLESDSRDFNMAVQADYSFGNSKRFFFTRTADQNRAQTMKIWMARGGYKGGWSLYDEATNYKEVMLFGQLHRRILLKRLVLFSQRLRIDNRWLEPERNYSYRFRYRAMFEREFLTGNTSIIPYVNIEPFWDSRYNAFNRVRIKGGSTVSWRPRFSFEGNIMYQYDSEPTPANLLVLNFIFHLYFETAKVRENAGKK